MGSGGQKAHQAIAIVPAGAVAELDTVADADGLEDSTGIGVAEYMAAVAGNLGAEDYDHVAQMVQSLPDEADAKALAKAYLTNLTDGDVQQLAADQGFDHPTLVGFGDTAQHPLVHWLDPAYPPDLESKTKIQAKAVERYQALQAGSTIGGLTLQDVEAAEAVLGIEATAPPPFETWHATPTEAASAMADVVTLTVAAETADYFDRPAAFAAAVAAENKLQSVVCPELGPSLAEMQASAAQTVDYLATHNLRPQVTQALHAEGLINEPEAKWLSPAEAIAVARHASGGSQIADLKSVAATRNDVVAKLVTHKANGIGTASSFADIDTSTDAGREQLLETVNSTQEAFALSTQANGWSASDTSAINDATLATKYGSHYLGKSVSKDFRAWAKTQKLPDLRIVAEAAGLTDATTAGTRAQIQSYLAGQWDTTIDQASIEASVKTKALNKQSKTVPTTTQPSATPTTPPSGTVVAAQGTPPTASGPGRFTGKLGTLTAKLKAHQQLAADLPTRTGTATVAAHTWDKGQSWSKGSHESSLHTGPDGSQWMFKPDKSAKGARAQAESAASGIYNRVGVPGVDVHVATIGKRTGTIQPLVKGAANLDADVSTWSQADVDSMVRLHVAAWAVGDHDGHTSNVMRSPSGAIFAVDQGQAFKFLGRDTLDHKWKPGGNYGTPVYHQAYTAHQNNGLGNGVHVRAKAALPAIKAFEALPDAQYRAMLTSTATEGVKHGVHWVAPMRKAAQKRLSKPDVTDADIAHEFLTTAIDRKNNLRSAFSEFFAGFGVDDAQHLTWVK